MHLSLMLLVDFESTKLPVPIGSVPIACYFFDQALPSNTKQENVRQIVVESLIAHGAEWLSLRTRDHHFCCNVSFVIEGDVHDLVGEVRKRVDKCRPDDLADSSYLAVTPNHPLLTPSFERHIMEVGVVRAELNHTLYVLFAVGIKKRSDPL